MSESNPSQPEKNTPQLDDELQREIDAALGNQSMDDLLAEADNADAPSDAGDQPAAAAGDAAPSGGQPAEIHHEIRRGRIVAIRGEDVFVGLAGDAGKMQGIVPLVQFDRPPRIGSIMDFVVERTDEAQGLIYLSREGAISHATWEQLQRGAHVDGRVTATNKGGLELEMVGGIRAFMPASQIDLHHVDDLEAFVGQKLEASVQEIDRKSKKVLLSRRHLLQQRQEVEKKKTLATLEVGQTIEGKVSNIVDFGAFVDIGGVDGLIHVSDLSYTHVNKPSEVVQPGQAVTVKVLKIDAEKERISLGLKQVQPDPWEGIETRYQTGGQVEGKVVRTASFGAFVEVEPGIEALLPISEMSWKRIHNPEEVVKAGDNVRLAVLSVDPAKKRMSLSLKQATGDPWVGAERKFAANSLVEGKVLGTTDFGAFVELETGIEGLVHISELSDRRVGKVEDVLKVGDVKQFRVLDISEDDRKIRLSLKQVDKPEPEGASAAEIAKHSQKPAKKQSRKDLKGGMGSGGGMGMGLGDLKL
ncbi:S1 RNA-binding domain-containing protein [Phycisphaerales bacterium AB-hyl4]|uniref:S1 RNA-binding domain-containing protein n=1 Tax=Natronomicrosphaera hydrolytica TaxID=3242702 RepID=A0ABV4U3Y3_9BACT